MNKKNEYLIFDIGGTFIKWAIVDSEYKIIENDKFNFDGQNNDAKKLMELIGKKIQLVSQTNSIKAIGISTAGIIDSKTTKILSSSNIKNYTNLVLRDELKQFTSLPVFAENDANAATLGEYTNPNVQAFKNVLMITLGTDIGGGIIINNHLYTGNGTAGEVGFQIIDGLRWGEFFSAKGLIKLVKKMNNKEMTTYDILASNDLKIIDAVNHWYTGIANGLSNLVVSMNFEAIIIGGGISESKYFSLDKIKNKMNEFMKINEFINSYKLFKATLGNKAAIIGMTSILNKNI